MQHFHSSVLVLKAPLKQKVFEVSRKGGLKFYYDELDPLDCWIRYIRTTLSREWQHNCIVMWCRVVFSILFASTQRSWLNGLSKFNVIPNCNTVLLEGSSRSRLLCLPTQLIIYTTFIKIVWKSRFPDVEEGDYIRPLRGLRVKGGAEVNATNWNIFPSHNVKV